MAILRNPESPETIERAKWEQHPSEWTLGGLRPGNPYVFRQYPKMLYMAKQLHNGKWATSEEAPTFFNFRDENEWQRSVDRSFAFTKSCQMTVNDESEHKRARDEGWRDTPQEAMEFRQSLEKAVGDAAAERNWQDRNMSEKAKAESAKVEAETFGHLPEIPEKPRRGRPRKHAA